MEEAGRGKEEWSLLVLGVQSLGLLPPLPFPFLPLPEFPL
jgi:hypothetical protein